MKLLWSGIMLLLNLLFPSAQAIRIITCLDHARHERGTSFTVRCIQGCAAKDYRVWGNGTYTHDSAICRAAIHDGRITDEGGVVTVYKQPGQESYVGVERNSIQSQAYGYWRSSISFSAHIKETPITCATTAQDQRFDFTRSFELICPAGCLQEDTRKVWGSVVYTHDSSICRTAIHDGRITDEGGEVTVYRHAGQPSYNGTERNSMRSFSHGYYKSSFSFTPAIPGGSDPEISCGTTAQDTRFSYQTSFEITCPSGCDNSSATVWGNGTYSHDSSICKAAIHDGIITKKGGTFIFYRQPGQPSYQGSSRNGITTTKYGYYWRSSFSFTPEIPEAPILCKTTAQERRFFSKPAFQILCPPDCVNSTTKVHGNVLYTDDSSVCRAAIHDGRIKDEGGLVNVFRQTGLSSYPGVTRHSITSLPNGRWSSSFSFTEKIPDWFGNDTVSNGEKNQNQGSLAALVIIPIFLILIGCFIWRRRVARRGSRRVSKRSENLDNTSSQEEEGLENGAFHHKVKSYHWF
ncbi:uncharacterized protein LOC143453158 [Clavelina lepadiformis]|uniref:uncharacterized protein LOC143453158 n=1 Tax=Clavelina lepadiformis TaxID=159417 RepID=UPI00404354BC